MINFLLSHIQVRSVTLDVRVWEPTILDLFKVLGNTYCNSIWEGLLQGTKRLGNVEAFFLFPRTSGHLFLSSWQIVTTSIEKPTLYSGVIGIRPCKLQEYSTFLDYLIEKVQNDHLNILLGLDLWGLNARHNWQLNEGLTNNVYLISFRYHGVCYCLLKSWTCCSHL